MKPASTRRAFLRGTGGVAVGLPLLPSLRPGPAYGDALPARRPHFVAITMDQGTLREADMFPAAARLTTRAEIYPGHHATHGPLVGIEQDADLVVSPVLTAPKSALSPKLVAKMNVLRGLDNCFGPSHQAGCHLGNFYGHNEEKDTSKWQPTIDQIMAWSPAFYPDLATIRERSIVVGSSHTPIRDEFSFYWENPQARSGKVAVVRSTGSSRAIFDRLFAFEGRTSKPAAARKPVVDAVLESYRRLRNGSRRLSNEDRRRLDAHIEQIAELQRKLGDRAAPVSCKADAPTKDSGALGDTYRNPGAAAERARLLNDVIALAFACGATRVAVVALGDSFSTYAGDWHNEIIHRAPYDGPSKSGEVTKAARLFFQAAVLDLAAKLDVDAGGGRTYLDDTLVAWTQESGGGVPHRSGDLPVVTFGSAGGFLTTGRYIDYRNRRNESYVYPAGAFVPGTGVFSPVENWAGLTWYQWLHTVLHAMGVPKADWAPGGKPWYGQVQFDAAPPHENPFKRAHYVNGAIDNVTEVLPLLRA